MLCYSETLSSILSKMYKQVKEALPKATKTDLQYLQLGRWVVLDSC